MPSPARNPLLVVTDVADRAYDLVRDLRRAVRYSYLTASYVHRSNLSEHDAAKLTAFFNCASEISWLSIPGGPAFLANPEMRDAALRLVNGTTRRSTCVLLVHVATDNRSARPDGERILRDARAFLSNANVVAAQTLLLLVDGDKLSIVE